MIPHSIKHYLTRFQAEYHQIHHERTETLCQAARVSGVPVAELLRAVMLVDAHGLVMAIVPHDHLLDFAALCQLLQRELEPVPAARLQTIFDDCEANCCPPLPGAYGLEAVVDQSILELAQVYLEPGVHDTLLGMTGREFRRLTGEARIGEFSRPVVQLHHNDPLASLDTDIERFTPARVKRTVEEFHDLPSLPGTAAQILEIAHDPRAGAADLARVIEQDAPLAAKVMRYANSPLYGFPNKIKDVKSAIARVLGFDFVLNLALGITVGKTLHIPTEGILGLDAFWRHSVHCAALVERLARALPAEIQPRRGTAYLAGLLHNIGVLLLGHAFQPEFFLLNRYLEANPHVPMAELEKHLLGVTHDRIGGWLLQSWGLPEELVVAARHHHDEDYWDRHALYAQLVMIANRALSRRGIGPADPAEIPAFTLDLLEIRPEQVAELADCVVAGSEELDELARLVA